MDKFVIEANDKELCFHTPQFNKEGWLEQYTLAFLSPNLKMSISVQNPPYGRSPAEFFQDLADYWSGWQGEKTWGAMEGEYSIEASMSRTGHASIRFNANVYCTPVEWVAIASVDIEAGQLDHLAQKAKLFFNQSL